MNKGKPNPKDDLKALPLSEVGKKLQSSAEGLTQTEAQKRLTQYGPNELQDKKVKPVLKFLSYFWGPIPSSSACAWAILCRRAHDCCTAIRWRWVNPR